MADQTAHKSISIQALDRLIAAHDGNVALLWLYWQRSGSLDAEKAAAALCLTLQEVLAAEEKLRRMALPEPLPAPAGTPAPGKPEPAPAEELPQYSSEEIRRRSGGNSALTTIYAEAAQVMGRALGGNDLRVLFGIYDHLGMPPEVILELLHFCAELCLWKYGESRRPTPRFLEKEAYAWANREILTLEQAEEYIRSRRERHSDLGRIREALHLSEFSSTQEKDVNTWLEQGFGEEAIAIAADRTVTNTGALKWNYLSRILQSWHQKGLHSPAEILEKEPPRARGKDPLPSKQDNKPVDPAALRKILEQI